MEKQDSNIRNTVWRSIFLRKELSKDCNRTEKIYFAKLPDIKADTIRYSL